MREYLAAACAVSGEPLPEGATAAGCGDGLACLSQDDLDRISEAGRQLSYRKYWQVRAPCPAGAVSSRQHPTSGPLSPPSFPHLGLHTSPLTCPPAHFSFPLQRQFGFEPLDP